MLKLTNTKDQIVGARGVGQILLEQISETQVRLSVDGAVLLLSSKAPIGILQQEASKLEGEWETGDDKITRARFLGYDLAVFKDEALFRWSAARSGSAMSDTEETADAAFRAAERVAKDELFGTVDEAEEKAYAEKAAAAKESA